MKRIVLLFLLAACGDDADEPVDMTPMDSGVRPRLDARMPELDTSTPIVEDASVDSGEPLPSYAECRGYVQSLHAANVSGRSFSSAVALNQIYVAYAIATCGGSASAHATQGLALVSTPTAGAPGEPMPFLNTSTCVRTSLPTLQTVRGALNVFYASNQDGSPQIYLHDDAGTQSLGSGLALDMAVDRTQLYYARMNAIYAQQAGGAPQLLLASNEGYALERIAASELGSTATMFAWTSSAESAQGAFLRVLDPGSATPSAAQAVGKIGPQSGLALASQSKRGAVVWADDQGSMWLRTVEPNGSLGAPVRLTSANQFVTDISVARYGIGYTIAFRATPTVSGQTVIRLLMVDDLGNTAKPRVISEARSDGHGVEVRVANDGRIVVVWADPGDGDTLIRVARLECI
ncbi:MAG TPA: hypothetical protein VFX59_14815 [Polyangiales bacterium]|nr:hypothetical protein [Polyangiales bacterium]